MIRRNAIRNAAAGAKLHSRLPRLALTLALLAGCSSRTAGCGLGNGCAGTASTAVDGQVSTTAATLGTTPGTAAPQALPAAPAPSGVIQAGQPEVTSNVAVPVAVPVPVAAPAATTEPAPPAAASTAPPAAAVVPAVPASSVAETRTTPARPAPAAPPQRQYSSEEIFSSSAVLAPRGYELSDAGAGPFSHGAGGPTGFPSDDGTTR